MAMTKPTVDFNKYAEDDRACLFLDQDDVRVRGLSLIQRVRRAQSMLMLHLVQASVVVSHPATWSALLSECIGIAPNLITPHPEDEMFNFPVNSFTDFYQDPLCSIDWLYVLGETTLKHNVICKVYVGNL